LTYKYAQRLLQKSALQCSSKIGKLFCFPKELRILNPLQIFFFNIYFKKGFFFVKSNQGQQAETFPRFDQGVGGLKKIPVVGNKKAGLR
jgi:hypothetical protein